MKRGEKARMLFELLCDMIYGEDGMPGSTNNKAFFEAFKDVVDAEGKATKELQEASEKMRKDFDDRFQGKNLDPESIHYMENLDTDEEAVSVSN